MCLDKFENIKKAYKDCREDQRRKIIDSLAKKIDANGQALFTKKNGKNYSNDRYRYSGGSGRINYGKKRLAPAYDLSNWKYIETRYKGNYVFISLQSFDIDPSSSSKNIHVLYDRIGLLFEEPQFLKVYPDEMKIKDSFIKMKTTNFELPLNDDEIDNLIDYIILHF